MTAPVRLRDGIRSYVPVWLSDRPGLNVGFRLLWSAAAILDTYVEFLLQGVQAAWPGIGTTTALPLIGRSRGLIRGKADTDETYAAFLRTWLEVHASGRTEELARQIQRYLGTSAKIRVVTRGHKGPTAAQHLVLAADGTVTRSEAAWDWDSVDWPDRVSRWSDMWVVVTLSPFGARSGTLGALTGTDDGYGLGTMIPRVDADTIRSLIAEWKGAHSRVVAVLFTSSATAYDPSVGGSLMPNGKWADWGTTGDGTRVPSDRDLTVTRWLEPN